MSKTDDAVMKLLDFGQTKKYQQLIFDVVIEARRDMLRTMTSVFKETDMTEAARSCEMMIPDVGYGGPSKPNKLAVVLLSMADEALKDCDPDSVCLDEIHQMWREVRSLARTRA